MKIFLGGIVHSGMSNPDTYDQSYRGIIKEQLRIHHPQVEIYCCNDDRSSDPSKFECRSPKENFEHFLQNVRTSKIFIGYLPYPSIGTAIELYNAYLHGVPTITITPLKMNWSIQAYSTHVFGTLEEFLDEIPKGLLVKYLEKANVENMAD